MPRSPAVPSARTEEERVASFARGEPDAIAHFFREHAPVVARVLARTGSYHPEEIEDLVQTTFLEAIRSAASFRATSSVRTWLLAIALNQARMFVRGKVRRDRALLRVAGTPEDNRTQADNFLEAENVARLRVALDKLPPLQREAVVLCELEGLSAKAVSEMLGIPPATVWRRVHDGRVSLRKLLTEGDR